MILFASTISLSAFLLFLVQPLIAKQILPWFGGTSAVWTTCLVFFQCVLLAGYLYADALIRRVRPARQTWVHLALLVTSVAVLPIIPSEALKPAGVTTPTASILWLLTVTIGLPFLVLSATGPLMQAWFARVHPGRPVYRLYALSNAASMAALWLYPTLIEPTLGVRAQAWLWSVAYVGLVLLNAWCVVRAASVGETPPPVPANASAHDGPAPDVAVLATWWLLSALPCALLLAVTTHLSQNVAPVPFLWVVPLSLYLLSFILCFGREGWYRSRWMAPAAAVASLLMMGGLIWRPVFGAGHETWGLGLGLMSIHHAAWLYGVGLFLVCMFCHGELATRKPAPAYLTRFYLMISVGGAAGGVLVGVVAPAVSAWTWEFPLALMMTSVLVAILAMAGRHRWTALTGLTCLVASGAVFLQYRNIVQTGAIELSRSFYGTLRVQTSGAAEEGQAYRRLMHGDIKHGEQFLSELLRGIPTSYYRTKSGVGRALIESARLIGTRGQRVGVIGLGVGTMAAYGRPGDHYRFYEINPDVVDLAWRHFTYLSQSQAQVITLLGDARLILESEPAQQLDLLAVDAFSSDAIPVHLLTTEAMETYRRHVRDDGVIAFHISNRYLDLSGVVRHMADTVGWQALILQDVPAANTLMAESLWVIVSGHEPLLQSLRRGGATEVPVPTTAPWSDDRSTLFEVLK